MLFSSKFFRVNDSKYRGRAWGVQLCRITWDDELVMTCTACNLSFKQKFWCCYRVTGMLSRHLLCPTMWHGVRTLFSDLTTLPTMKYAVWAWRSITWMARICRGVHTVVIIYLPKIVYVYTMRASEPVHILRRHISIDHGTMRFADMQ